MNRPCISDPLHQTLSGSSPVPRPAVSAPEQPFGNSRTPAYPPSPGPSQFSRDHSFRRTRTRRGAGHHSSSTGPHEQNLSSSPIANDIEFEAAGRRHKSTLDEHPPPLGVKLTGYRLLYMSVVFTVGMTKVILIYMGRSAMPTTLDWIGGTFLSVM